MKRWKWAVLITELVLFALILILPQVELPEFAFHGGTSPVAFKLRSSPTQHLAAVAVHTQSASAMNFVFTPNEEVSGATVPAHPHSRLSLLCVLIC
jgi:hypothetical protein